MKLFITTFSLTVLLSFACFAQFTADMVTTESGVTKTNKFYSENPFYRMDIEEQGQEGYVIVNRNEGVTKVVMPAEQMFMEISSTGMMSQMNDVFQSIDNLKETSDPTLIGTETINGYECEKYNVIRDGNTIMTFWQSTALGYPLKVINQLGNGMTMELKNIVEGDVDDSMFQIPDGYTKMEMPGMK